MIEFSYMVIRCFIVTSGLPNEIKSSRQNYMQTPIFDHEDRTTKKPLSRSHLKG